MPSFNYCQYYKGESIYGLITNYHIESCHRDYKQTNLNIFGRTHVRLHPVLPNNINAIAQFFGLDPNKLLNQATGYPLYAFSLGSQSHQLKKVLLSSKGQLITSYSRHAQSSLPLAKQYRYCPLCIKESLNKQGKLIWLIEHQLYGVCYCSKHKQPLFYLNSGEGGINRRYLLPEGGKPILLMKNNKALHLSCFMTRLYRLLQSEPTNVSIGKLYEQWLNVNGFLTKCGYIRMRLLSAELFNFWKELFENVDILIPLELSNFNYVADIIHERRPVHYLKHVMLMAFLAKSPQEFFALTKKENHQTTPDNQEQFGVENSVFKLLDNGVSLRKISKKLEVSVGYIKQLALRNHYKINRRRSKLTDEMERDIWRKAFVGWHRVDIAKHHDISVASVEQIIQSHKGLSSWRRHMVMVNRKTENRQAMLNAIERNPKATRNKLKHSFTCYMWLYKNDREWLYQNLPSSQIKKYYPSVDWIARDRFLANKIKYLSGSFKSLSELDRALGGHSWLLHDAKKLPLSLKEALLIIANSITNETIGD